MTRLFTSIALVLALSACSRADEVEDVCYNALDGVEDHEYIIRDRCRKEVYYAGWKAEHLVAQKYRDLPRR